MYPKTANLLCWKGDLAQSFPLHDYCMSLGRDEEGELEVKDYSCGSASSSRL